MPENLDDRTTHVENKTETSSGVTSAPCSNSNPREDGSTAAQQLTAAKCYVPPCGVVFYIMAFFSFFCAFALRASLSVAIVAMVNQTALADDVVMTNISDTGQCPRDPALQSAGGEFTWDRYQQGTVLAAYYYGAVFTQMPGGWLADRFGGKWLCGGCVLLASVVSLLTPAAARLHIGVLMALRILSGLGGGVHLPAINALIARWSVPRYHSLVAALIYSGISAGIIVGMLLSGVLCDHGFAGGWPSAFYVFGIIGCVWSVAWFLLCYNSPSTHPRISTSEREYWDSVIGTTDLVARPPTPWRKILTSVPVWALAIVFFANDWGFTLATCIPLFMYDVLGFDMTNNGALSAVPFLATIGLIPLGWFADWLRSPGRLSTNVVRKSFCAVGCTLTGIVLISVGYTGCNRALAVFLMFLTIAVMCILFTTTGVNQLDLAPLHAGKIAGFTNFVATGGQISVPHAIGSLTYHQSRSEWQNVFFLAAGIFAVGLLVFVIFGSGERQSWAGKPEVHTINIPQLPEAVSVQETHATTMESSI